MLNTPAVSIIIPTYNDEAWVAAALESCLQQTAIDIEVICVDDASTDTTPAIIQGFCHRDPRVRLIHQSTNCSAFQARRVGVEAASAPYILFLDGDDELAPQTVEIVLERARATGADVVGFGVDMIVPEGVRAPAFQADLQPKHAELSAPHILPTLFPVGKPAQGHLWGYLLATKLVRDAYAGLPEDLRLYRANDLPIAFLTIASASTYLSVPDRLYRYYFRRGTSGHAVTDIDGFTFYLGAIDSIEQIDARVRVDAGKSADPSATLACYQSARLSVIGTVLRYCTGAIDEDLQDACFERLRERVEDGDIVRAAADFHAGALSLLTRRFTHHATHRQNVRSVLIATGDLLTGGVQGVVVSQAQHLVAAGLNVTIALHRAIDPVFALPEGVRVLHIEGATMAEKLESWHDICRRANADVVVHHHIFYGRFWPFFVHAARALGIPTVGWLHNFALRPLLDDNTNTSFLVEHLPLLETVVVLSAVDVAYWKLRGIDRVVYLPNPASPMMQDLPSVTEPKELPAGPIKLLWWGRLQQSTKQVRSLIELVSAIRARGADVELTIIGPDTKDLSAAQLLADAVARGVADIVYLRGPLHGRELVDALAEAHLYVTTSVIEGYPLALVEAQVLGLPIAMFELPWLTAARGDAGVIAVPQGDVQGLARQIAELSNSPERYRALSAASLVAARRAAAQDFGELYTQLLSGSLPPEFSPEPTVSEAQLLLEWANFYAERNVRSHERLRAQTKALGREAASLRRQLITTRRKVIAERERAAGLQRKLWRVSVGQRLSHLVSRVLVAGRGRTQPPARRETPVPPASPVEPVIDRQPYGVFAESDADALSEHEESPTAGIDVSIVIRLHGSASWFDECLNSVLAQTDVAIEVICVEECSTINGRAILEDRIRRDPRVRMIEQSNGELPVGLDAGLDAATGKYVVFLDGEDYWAEDALSALVRRADADALDVLLFDGHAFRDGDVGDALGKHDDAHDRPRSQEYGSTRSGIDMIIDMRSRGDYRTHAALYLTRTGYVRGAGLRLIPGIEHQDHPYTFTLLLNASRTAHVRTVLHARRLRPGSPMTTLAAANSAKGYFLGYVAMLREVYSREVSAAAAVELSGIVNDVYTEARNEFVCLPDSIGDELGTLDPTPEAQLAFLALRSARADLRTRSGQLEGAPVARPAGAIR